jgi:hypothetical protein
MATNFIAVNTLLSKNSLASMHNELSFLKLVDRQLDSQWGDKVNGFKPGDTYKINRPMQARAIVGNSMSFNPTTGTWDTQSFVEDPIFVTLSTNDQRFVPVQFSSKELTLAMDSTDSRLGDPAGLKLASVVEQKSIKESVLHGGSAFYSGQTLAVPDASKFTIEDGLLAQAFIDQLAAPMSERSVMVAPKINAQLASQNLTLFTPTVNDDVYAKGYINEFAGAKWFRNNLLPIYEAVPGTVATLAQPIQNGNANVYLKGLAPSSTYPEGTVFTITDWNRVNPETKVKVDVEYQFALSQDMVTDGSGNGIAVLDSSALIYGASDTGNRQNIAPKSGTADLPATDTGLVILGATNKRYYQTVYFYKEAYTATVVPLITDLPGAFAARADHDGVSIRTSVQTVIGSDTVVTRFDTLSVSKLMRDQYCVRILTEV